MERSRPEFRRNDYSLTEEQQAVQETFAEFFLRECPSSRVRDAEPLGYDEKLWRSLARTGAATMGVPEDLGGGGASLVDLVLVAEKHGRHVAPVPLIEAAVALRLLAAAAPEEIPAWIDAEGFPTLALNPAAPDGTPQLVPAAAVAGAVIALTKDEPNAAAADGAGRAGRSGGVGGVGGAEGAEAMGGAGEGAWVLALYASSEAPPHIANQGRAPLAWWAPQPGGRTLARGPRARELYEGAVREWKLLTAAALAGLGEGAQALGLDFVLDRKAFDTPIGAFQAISHALADGHTGVTGARNLARKAAWFADHEPDARPELIPMAFAYAAQAATEAVTVATHVQGGFGFTVESDVQLYFRRAKGWSVVAGDPRAELAAIGDIIADRVGS